MKQIIVRQRYYTIHEIYKVASYSSARRGLFGYMLKTSRLNDTIFGGAMNLIIDIERSKNKIYQLVIDDDRYGKEIVEIAQAAIDGVLEPYAVSPRIIRKYTEEVYLLDLDY